MWVVAAQLVARGGSDVVVVESPRRVERIGARVVVVDGLRLVGHVAARAHDGPLYPVEEPRVERARGQHHAEPGLVGRDLGGDPRGHVTPARAESPDSGAFRRGERVFHQKFGYGSIKSVEGERLNIRFDKAGDKKVIASFVVPADQAG